MKPPFHSVVTETGYGFVLGDKTVTTQPIVGRIDWWWSPPRQRTVMYRQPNYRVLDNGELEYFRENIINPVPIRLNFPALVFGRVDEPAQRIILAFGAANNEKEITIDTPMYGLCLPHCNLNGYVCMGDEFAEEEDIQTVDPEAAFFNTTFCYEEGKIEPGQHLLYDTKTYHKNSGQGPITNQRYLVKPTTIKHLCDIFVDQKHYPSNIGNLISNPEYIRPTPKPKPKKIEIEESAAVLRIRRLLGGM